jgi:cell division protein FtsB
MALNSHVSLKVPFVAVAVVLLLVSSAFAYYYLNSASELSDRNREVASLQSNLNELNAKVSSLNLEIDNLQSNQTASKALLSSLELEVSQLQNDSARLQLELSIVEQVGKLSIYTYYVNDTMTVAPNSTVLLTSQVNGYNGTIVFISPNGCYSAGAQAESVQPQYVLDILLNSNSPPLTSAYTSLSGQPYSVYFKNIGSSPVQCTFSLFYVYQKPD